MTEVAALVLLLTFLVGVGSAVIPPRARGERRRALTKWDPSGREVAELGGPLVYFARKRGTDEVKVGFTTRTGPERIGEWATGVSAPVDVEGLMVGPIRLERALHRALRRRGAHIHDEWFRLPRGEGWWRELAEEVAGA